MERKVVFFVFATSILAFARRGNCAFVPRPYEELLSNLADKYGDEMAKRNVYTKDSSGMFYILKN